MSATTQARCCGCDVEHYLKTLHLIALCYLLQREDLLPRLLEVILANAEDDLEPDTTIEDFLDYHLKIVPIRIMSKWANTPFYSAKRCAAKPKKNS